MNTDDIWKEVPAEPVAIDWSNAPKDYDLFLEFNDDHKKFVNGTEGEFARFNGDVYLMEFGGYRTRVEVERMFIFHRRPVAPTWNGEGKPPVNVEIEMKCKAATEEWARPDFHPATLLFVGKEIFVTDEETVGHLSDYLFRPIRTHEQKAAEDRDRVVRGILERGLKNGAGVATILKEAYDAGCKAGLSKD